MQISEKHLKRIKKRNEKFPLMEYFLDGKKLEDCSKECQEQINWIKNLSNKDF